MPIIHDADYPTAANDFGRRGDAVRLQLGDRVFDLHVCASFPYAGRNGHITLIDRQKGEIVVQFDDPPTTVGETAARLVDENREVYEELAKR